MPTISVGRQKPCVSGGVQDDEPPWYAKYWCGISFKNVSGPCSLASELLSEWRLQVHRHGRR